MSRRLALLEAQFHQRTKASGSSNWPMLCLHSAMNLLDGDLADEVLGEPVVPRRMAAGSQLRGGADPARRAVRRTFSWRPHGRQYAECRPPYYNPLTLSADVCCAGSISRRADAVMPCASASQLGIRAARRSPS